MKYQRIEEKGNVYVKVPLDVFEDMLDDIHDLSHIDELRAMLAGIRRGEIETFPSEFCKKLDSAKTVGERISLWREYRKLTQAQLAKLVKVSRNYISMLEANKRKGDIETIKHITAALDINVEDIF